MAIIKLSTAKSVEDVLNPLISNFSEKLDGHVKNFAQKTGEIWAGNSAVSFAKLAQDNFRNLYSTFEENIKTLARAINNSIALYETANEEQLDRVMVSFNSNYGSFESLDEDAYVKTGKSAGWVGLIDGHNTGEVINLYDALVTEVQQLCDNADTSMQTVAEEVYDDANERSGLTGAMSTLSNYVKQDLANLRTVLEESLNAKEELIKSASTETTTSYTNLTQ